MPNTINVLVAVNTADITSSNLSSTVILIDDNGDSDDTSGDSTTFDIHASAGDSVHFSIIAIDGSTSTSLSSFAQESGSPAVFSDLPDSGNGWTGTVSTSVTGTEHFSITFMVGSTSYTLDPILKTGQG